MPLFLPYASLGSDATAAAVPAISGAYYIRRNRWIAAACIAFFLLVL